MLFPPLAVVSLVIGAVLIARDKARAATAIIICALACGAIGSWLGVVLFDLLQADATADNLQLYEREIAPALSSQTGTAVDDIGCVSRSDTSARCLATFEDGSSVGITVELDRDSGEWIWQTDR